MNIKKLIDQIGGRERLAKLVAQYEEDGYCEVKDDEVIAAVLGLLAVLDAQQKPFMYAISDCEGKAHFDESCVSAHGCDLEDVVGSLNDFREGVDDGYSIVPVYTVPPAASVPDGWKLVPIEPNWSMLNAAINFHEGEAFLPASLYKAMLAAAPAPGGNGG